MAVNTVNFTINLNGNAYNGIVNMNAAFGNFNSAAEKAETLFGKLGDKALRFNGILQTAQTVAGKVGNAIGKVMEIGGENELQRLDMTTLFQGNSSAAEEILTIHSTLSTLHFFGAFVRVLNIF